MPTIEENQRMWEAIYHWDQEGEEWSSAWGGSELQWLETIFPRLHAFVPTETILEIAPGFGRWTQYLKTLCKNLVVVDLSEKCIQACKERFSSYAHITYHVNDGKSLDMIPDGSIDLVFSFDSLVHAEEDVLQAYINQLARKLKRDGVGFIHHSNLGAYRTYSYSVGRATSLLTSLLTTKLPNSRKVSLLIERLKNLDHWRATSMTAEKFEDYVEKAGMQCIGQEIVNWGHVETQATRRLIDCVSLFTLKDSIWARPNKVVRNRHFMKEAKWASRLSELYTVASFRREKIE
jgi:2-polyprenyl-3-methyl-5-hydroxy-6-metoxy-1,4-benzoquinol methylase